MKLAVITFGWHFPLHFYKSIKNQKVPEGWEIDYFCVSHRDPEELKPERPKGDGFLIGLDNILYEKIAKVKDLEKLGFKYSQEKNHAGEIVNINQWSEKNNYENYDVIFTSHDDTFIINNNLFVDVLEDNCILWEKPGWYGGGSNPYPPPQKHKTIKSTNQEWLFISNSAPGNTEDGFGHSCVRFDFWKKDFLSFFKTELDSKKLFNIPEINQDNMSSWNIFSDIISDTKDKKGVNHLHKYLSPYFRVSPYALEGCRGLVSHGGWRSEWYDEGLKYYKIKN